MMTSSKICIVSGRIITPLIINQCLVSWRKQGSIHRNMKEQPSELEPTGIFDFALFSCYYYHVLFSISHRLWRVCSRYVMLPWSYSVLLLVVALAQSVPETSKPVHVNLQPKNSKSDHVHTMWKRKSPYLKEYVKAGYFQCYGTVRMNGCFRGDFSKAMIHAPHRTLGNSSQPSDWQEIDQITPDWTVRKGKVLTAEKTFVSPRQAENCV